MNFSMGFFLFQKVPSKSYSWSDCIAVKQCQIGLPREDCWQSTTQRRMTEGGCGEPDGGPAQDDQEPTFCRPRMVIEKRPSAGAGVVLRCVNYVQCFCSFSACRIAAEIATTSSRAGEAFQTTSHPIRLTPAIHSNRNAMRLSLSSRVDACVKAT